MGAVRDFASERGLDVSYLPGIQRVDANRFTVLDEPIYYEAATALLSDRREQFYRDYAFHVRPASDDRPHFFRFFRWRSAGRFIEGARHGWFNFVEWGYVALVATVAQAAIMGFLLVLLPLILFARGSGDGLGAASKSRSFSASCSSSHIRYTPWRSFSRPSSSFPVSGPTRRIDVWRPSSVNGRRR
jgi:hypothetical protein